MLLNTPPHRGEEEEEDRAPHSVYTVEEGPPRDREHRGAALLPPPSRDHRPTDGSLSLQANSPGCGPPDPEVKKWQH